MTHNQVNYTIGKMQADVAAKNAETNLKQYLLHKKEYELAAHESRVNEKANAAGMAIGTGIAVSAIVGSIIVAAFA